MKIKTQDFNGKLRNVIKEKSLSKKEVVLSGLISYALHELGLEDLEKCKEVVNERYYPKEEVAHDLKRLKEDLKKEFCSGFVSLSEECFEREWKKAYDKNIGDLQ